LPGARKNYFGGSRQREGQGEKKEAVEKEFFLAGTGMDA
jgi:hypothetical protein